MDLFEDSRPEAGHADAGGDLQRWGAFEADTLKLEREVASHGAQLLQLTRWRRDQTPRPAAGPGDTLATTGSGGGGASAERGLLAEVRLGLRASEEQSAAA